MAGLECEPVSQIFARGPAVGTPLSACDPISADIGNTELSLFNVSSGQPATVIIEGRTLIRDCFVKALKDAMRAESVCAFGAISEWIAGREKLTSPSLILLCAAERSEAEILSDIALISQADPEASIVVLSDSEDPSRVIGVLDKGARGYIPTSMSLDVAVEAMHLVRAGGTFAPTSCLMASRGPVDETGAAAKGASAGLFTARQSAVAEALRQGKGNKMIAYELNMRESTVKVHVRNIMRKLNARNRTEVAFRMNGMSMKESGR